MKQFNTGAVFTVPLISGTRQEIPVNWPPDAKWADKARRVRIVEREIGRGKVDREVVGAEEACLDLYNALRADGSPDLDQFEARAVVDQLEATEIIDVQRDGDTFTVTMEAHGCDLTHQLRTPTQRQMHEFNRARLKSTPTRRAREIRFDLAPAGVLYDAIAISATGYAAAIPLPHKFAVVTELLDEIDRELSADADPER
jgi:hypothetical protein